MTLVVRKIDYKRLWDKGQSQEEPWLAPDDLAADALRDISTERNRLSVYILDGAIADLDRVIAALAAGRKLLVKLDYVTFDLELLTELDIHVEKCSGTTADADVNKCHLDLVELSAPKLAAFGLALKRRGTAGRKLDKPVGALLISAIQAGQIDRTRLSSELLEKLRGMGLKEPDAQQSEDNSKQPL